MEESRHWNGLRAAEIREAAGLRPRHVAIALGVSPSSLVTWERAADDGGSEPRASVVAQLADLYGVPCDQLFLPPGSPVRWLRGRNPNNG